MDAPDEMVEAVRDAVFRAQPDWRGTPNLTALDAEHIASAVLSVPALAEVIARDAKVREWADQNRPFIPTWLAALYPEAGK